MNTEGTWMEEGKQKHTFLPQKQNRQYKCSIPLLEVFCSLYCVHERFYYKNLISIPESMCWQVLLAAETAGTLLCQ